MVGAGQIPARRGLSVTPLDIMIREVISHLMSHFAVDPYAIAEQHGIRYDFWREQADLEKLIAVGYVKQMGESYHVTRAGQPFLRAIATLFDHYFPQDTSNIIDRCVHESEG